MLALVVLVFSLPFIIAIGKHRSFYYPPPCDGHIKVKSVPMMKGGVSYVKLAVDNNEPIEVHFSVDPLLEIDKIKWTLNKNPIDVDQDEPKSAVYWKRDSLGIVLVIRYPKQQFIGNWQMEILDMNEASSKQSCQLQSPPMVQRFIESFRSTEGYELSVVCKSGSLPYPSRVQWFRAEGTGDSAVLLPIYDVQTTHIPGDTLLFKEAKMSDTGVYLCNTTVTPEGLFDSSAAEVKIKSRFAALWPFIGILAELIILLITIILYERHKAARRKAAEAQNHSLSTPVSPSGDTKPQQSETIQA
ncbi:Basigin [Echinococcus granulosus]|uniref:Immunoglobulin domain containing protein n=1 Tax=Echinococcus granulosus TaxID=6210 RepID=A0A068X377_ECHGR|nr:Basigin [Echinococcus granulosus]CDS24349.1 Immunoglobulin domain containing protein [Echinococcus granulosus]